MKKTVKRVTTAIIATVMCMSATTAAFAASTTDTPVVDENNSNAEFQQQVEYSKSESEIVPAYTVTIPTTLTLARSQQHSNTHLLLKTTQHLFLRARR